MLKVFATWRAMAGLGGLPPTLTPNHDENWRGWARRIAVAWRTYSLVSRVIVVVVVARERLAQSAAVAISSWFVAAREKSEVASRTPSLSERVTTNPSDS